MAKAQLDMFAEAEAELFPPGPVIAYPDEGRVRGKLSRMLAELRADLGPLAHERRRYFEQVVPQMSLALPEDERAQVRRAFAAELERLG
ncbi:hypothetical protein [Devosia sp.]|uniref:hypothetical protein n=1 Tax=Devosia sp. TaxID=1871048 RepID=UPI002F159B38